jgi:2'-5' RNA ligase
MRQNDLFADGGAAKPAEVHRLFFALMPDEATRERLHRAAMQLKATHEPHGRWINPRRYHLTLQFLGDFEGLPPQIAEQACEAAAHVRVAPFSLVLDRAGSFRNRAIPWWLGPAEKAPGLDALWHGLGTALARAGVRVPGRQGFRPHVTVLRDAGIALPETAIEPVEWRLAAFTLVHSVLGAHSAYTPLGTWPLNA